MDRQNTVQQNLMEAEPMKIISFNNHLIFLLLILFIFLKKLGNFFVYPEFPDHYPHIVLANYQKYLEYSVF